MQFHQLSQDYSQLPTRPTKQFFKVKGSMLCIQYSLKINTPKCCVTLIQLQMTQIGPTHQPKGNTKTVSIGVSMGIETKNI